VYRIGSQGYWKLSWLLYTAYIEDDKAIPESRIKSRIWDVPYFVLQDMTFAVLLYDALN
jgi:hypothetical protein